MLEIQRHKRYRLFDQGYQKIPPLVPRRLSFGIPERVDSAGTVTKPLDEAALREALGALAAEGIEALGICFLFSFRNASHEKRAGINISRILQGGGYYAGAAAVDLAEVGVGGGSIAWLDSGSVLKVGPQSAGADPGPIAYGLGGDQVTVTDANLLLGRIPAEYFLGGEMRLDLERARATLQRQLAAPLNITVEEASAAVIEVANASMLKMLRVVTVEKGCDPGDFSLVPFGGNGPVHGIELAGDLGIREVIVPPSPGLLSAQGLLVADIRYDFKQTYVEPVMAGNIDEVEGVFRALEERGREALQRYGLALDAISFVRSADMRYRRQAYEINVRMPDGALSGSQRPAIAAAFHEVHERLYGRRDAAGTVEFVTLCVSAVGNSRRLQHTPLPQGSGSAQAARKPNRKVFFRDVGMTECPCYDRALLRAGDTLRGPAMC